MTTSSDTLDELHREIEWLKSTVADYEQILDQGHAEDKRLRAEIDELKRALAFFDVRGLVRHRDPCRRSHRLPVAGVATPADV